MAIDHNEFVAQTTNRQTVLNILRAREREPMHYTSFSTVSGTVRATGQVGLGIAGNGDSGSLTRTNSSVTSTGAGGAVTGGSATATLTEVLSEGATNLTPSVTLGVTTGTDFQIAVNATDEFYKGILGPLSSSTVVHFLRQGYPADLLSHLVIGRFEFYAVVTGPGQDSPRRIHLRTIANAPDEAARSEEFGQVLRCRQLSYAVRSVPASNLPIEGISDMSGVGADVLGRLKPPAGADDTSYQLVTPARTEFALALSPPTEGECGSTRTSLDADLSRWMSDESLTSRPRPEGGGGRGAQLEGQLVQGVQTPSDRAGTPSAREDISESFAGPGGASFGSKGYFNDILPEGYTGDLVIETTLRSVEGVIYYLGEYVRTDGLGPMLWHDDCPGAGYCLPIIRVLPASEVPPARRFVDVVYRGRLYAVPVAGARLSRDSGRSSQSIALVQQLLNLHRSSRDFPTTPLVRVVN